MCDMEPRKELSDFAGQMERKLRANDHKGGWQDMPLSLLIHLARKEIVELEAKIQQGAPAIEAIEEAADAANFLMMVADQRASGRGLEYCGACRVVHTRYGEEFANCAHACHFGLLREPSGGGVDAR